MSAIRFRFKEKLQPHDYVNALAFDLSDPFPVEEILRGTSVIRNWDEKRVRDILDTFVPKSGRIFLKAKDYIEDFVGTNAVWETERWYGTQYCVQRFSETDLHKV